MALVRAKEMILTGQSVEYLIGRFEDCMQNYEYLGLNQRLLELLI